MHCPHFATNPGLQRAHFRLWFSTLIPQPGQPPLFANALKHIPEIGALKSKTIVPVPFSYQNRCKHECGGALIVAFQWRSLVLASLLIAALPSAGGARAAEPQVPVLWDAKERLPKPDLSALPRLRFLTTTDFPPFNFLDGAGRLSGFHVDLARAICAELGIVDKCQIQALPWGELEGALEKGEGEAIIAGIAATPQSRQTYAFSRSYLQFPARFIMPKGKALDRTDLRQAARQARRRARRLGA